MPFYVGVGLRYWDFEYCDRNFRYDGSAIGIRIPIRVGICGGKCRRIAPGRRARNAVTCRAGCERRQVGIIYVTVAVEIKADQRWTAIRTHACSRYGAGAEILTVGDTVAIAIAVGNTAAA